MARTRPHRNAAVDEALRQFYDTCDRVLAAARDDELMVVPPPRGLDLRDPLDIATLKAVLIPYNFGTVVPWPLRTPLTLDALQPVADSLAVRQRPARERWSRYPTRDLPRAARLLVISDQPNARTIISSMANERSWTPGRALSPVPVWGRPPTDGDPPPDPRQTAVREAAIGAYLVSGSPTTAVSPDNPAYDAIFAAVVRADPTSIRPGFLPTFMFGYPENAYPPPSRRPPIPRKQAAYERAAWAQAKGRPRPSRPHHAGVHA